MTPGCGRLAGAVGRYALATGSVAAKSRKVWKWRGS